MLTEMEPGRGGPSVLPLRAGPRRQVSGSPRDFYRVLRKGGLTWKGEHGSGGQVSEVGGEMVREGPEGGITKNSGKLLKAMNVLYLN